MNAERLLKHYERIGDAPDAIPRLRRFVLDLAVRGKLVPQDPSDEPASQLLGRIENARLVLASGQSSLLGVTDTDVPFSIPATWRWTRFAAVAAFSAGRTPSRNDLSFWNNGDHAWVSIADMPDGDTLSATKETVSDKARERVFRSKPEPPGTMLMSFKLTIGKISRLGIPAFHNEAIVSIRPYISDLDAYLFKILPQCAGRGATKDAIKGATLNRDSISNILLPLPPAAEQRRIVAKVDELMALCDRLEHTRAEREAARDRLGAASLARLNSRDQDRVGFASNARNAINKLDALTARADQIAQLRQTIVNVAVRGGLVPQDLNDELAEPVSQSLTHTPRLLPESWGYRSLADLLDGDTRNGYSRRPDEAATGTPILRISAGTARTDGVVAEEEHKLISGINSDLRLRYGLRRGDLLACRFNGNKSFVGRFAIFKDYLGIQPIYPDKLIRVRVVTELVLPAFLRVASDSDLVRSDVESLCATTVGNWGISASKLKQVRFPVPPIAEQLRIVAKVDELMTICHQLEASLNAGEDTRRRLLGALLTEALAPTTSGAT